MLAPVGFRESCNFQKLDPRLSSVTPLPSSFRPSFLLPFLCFFLSFSLSPIHPSFLLPSLPPFYPHIHSPFFSPFFYSFLCSSSLLSLFSIQHAFIHSSLLLTFSYLPPFLPSTYHTFFLPFLTKRQAMPSMEYSKTSALPPGSPLHS